MQPSAAEAGDREHGGGARPARRGARCRRRRPIGGGAARRATRRCSTRAACSRCSSATSRATRPRWSSGCAACRRSCSCGSASCVTENSGRERTTAFAYAVGWTQHTVGVQYIRTAAILQTLLGNIGRPGGGILALRGHAVDPGLDRHPDAVQPAARLHPDAARAPARDLRLVRRRGGRGEGLLGQHARVHREPAEGVVGRRRHAPTTTSASTTCRGSPATTAPTRPSLEQIDGDVQGYFLMGENPAVGSAQRARCSGSAMAQPRLAGRARLLADRERDVVEGRPGDRDRRAAHRGHRAPRCSSCPRPRTPRRTARSPTRSGCCSGTTRRSSRAATPRSELWFMLPPRPAHPREAGRVDRRRCDRPVLDLTWDYPTDGPARRARRRGGAGGDQRLGRRRRAARRRTPSCATTARPTCGCWIYCGVLRRRHQPGRPPQARVRSRAGSRRSGAGRGRRTGGSSTTARRPTPTAGRGASARRTCGGTRTRASGRATTCPTSQPTRRPDYEPPTGRDGPDALGGRRSVHHAGRRQGVAVRAGRSHRRPAADALRAAGVAGRQRAVRASSATRRASSSTQRRHNLYHPSGGEPGSDVFPYVVHHLPAHRAPHRRRDVPVAAVPRPSCNRRCSARSRPELAAERGLEHLGWATIVTAARRDRGAGPRHRADASRHGRRPARPPDRPAVPLGPERLLDRRRRQRARAPRRSIPNVHIQEVKALTCDMQPGGGPRRGAGRAGGRVPASRRHHVRHRPRGLTVEPPALRLDRVARVPADSRPASKTAKRVHAEPASSARPRDAREQRAAWSGRDAPATPASSSADDARR